MSPSFAKGSAFNKTLSYYLSNAAYVAVYAAHLSQMLVSQVGGVELSCK